MIIPNIMLNDGNTIPQLGLGVWQVTGNKTVPAVLAALEAGYRHIDTAAAYYNEQGVGQAIRESGIRRDELFVTTKLDTSDMGRPREALERSLVALGLDYVDLYLIHWPVPRHRKRFDAWDAMERARSEGLIRSVGVSNFTPKYLTEFLDRGGVVPAVNQIEYHPTYQQRDLQTFGEQYGIMAEAYSPLGMGAGPKAAAIGRIAERLGRTPAQIILRWHLQQGRIVIPKSANPERLTQNLAVIDFELDIRDLETIDALHTGQFLGWDPERV